MRGRGNVFLPVAEACEARLLLSTSHQPLPYVGTIHGDIVAVGKDGSQPVYQLVRASGTVTPFGKVGVVDGQVVDSYGRNGVAFYGDFVDRQITFALTSRGKTVVEVQLDDPFILSAEPIQAKDYPATIENSAETISLGTRIGTLALPKGSPATFGKLVPFTLTFRVGATR